MPLDAERREGMRGGVAAGGQTVTCSLQRPKPPSSPGPSQMRHSKKIGRALDIPTETGYVSMLVLRKGFPVLSGVKE